MDKKNAGLKKEVKKQMDKAVWKKIDETFAKYPEIYKKVK